MWEKRAGKEKWVSTACILMGPILNFSDEVKFNPKMPVCNWNVLFWDIVQKDAGENGSRAQGFAALKEGQAGTSSLLWMWSCGGWCDVSSHPKLGMELGMGMPTLITPEEQKKPPNPPYFCTEQMWETCPTSSPAATSQPKSSHNKVLAWGLFWEEEV